MVLVILLFLDFATSPNKFADIKKEGFRRIIAEIKQLIKSGSLPRSRYYGMMPFVRKQTIHGGLNAEVARSRNGNRAAHGGL